MPTAFAPAPEGNDDPGKASKRNGNLGDADERFRVVRLDPGHAIRLFSYGGGYVSAWRVASVLPLPGFVTNADSSSLQGPFSLYARITTGKFKRSFDAQCFNDG